MKVTSLRKPLERCQSLSSTQVELSSLLSSLQELESVLESVVHDSPSNNDDPMETEESDELLENCVMTLLNLPIPFTGSNSSIFSTEQQVHRVYFSCLDLCGLRTSLLAAIKVCKTFNKVFHPDADRSNSTVTINMASILASIRIFKRQLLSTLPQDVDKYDPRETKPISVTQVLHDFWMRQYDAYPYPCARPTTSAQQKANAVDEFLNIIILLPAQISSACHQSRLVLPSWASRSKYFPRIVECTAFSALLGCANESKNNSIQANDENSSQCHEMSIEEMFLQKLVNKIVLSGLTDELANGLYKFWKDSSSKDNSVKLRCKQIVGQAIEQISSPRESACLLRSCIKLIVSKIEIYPSNMNQEQKNTICQDDCMSFVKDMCLSVLQQSEMLRQSFFQLMVLSPSPSANPDIEELKLVIRCVTTLLAACDEDYDEESSIDQQPRDVELNGGESKSSSLTTYLLNVAMIWRESLFIENNDHLQQRYITEFILNAIDFIDKDDTDYSQQSITTELVSGITNRLKYSAESIRLDGMTVAEKLSPLLGEETFRFEELDGRRDRVPRHDVKERCMGHINESDDTESNLRFKTDCKLRRKRSGTMYRQGRKSDKALASIDPDEEFNSDDSSQEEESVSSNVGSITTLDSDWEEENLAMKFSDDEEDLCVVAKPLYLRTCLDLLRSDGDNHDTLCKHQAALAELANLVEAKPVDLADYAVALVKNLIYIENKFDLDSFQQQRMDGLCALVSCEPLQVIPCLNEHFFSDSISFDTRLEILEVMKQASSRLSGTTITESTRSIDRQYKTIGRRKFLTDEELISEVNKMSISRDESMCEYDERKTRKWKHSKTHIKTAINRFGELSTLFFYPLVQGLVKSRDNESLWKGHNGDRLVSHILLALSTFVHNSGYHPSTSALAVDMFELSWSFHDARSSDIRGAVLLSLLVSIPFLKQEYISHVIFNTENVPKFLHLTKTTDTNKGCRHLATKILQCFDMSGRSAFERI